MHNKNLESIPNSNETTVNHQTFTKRATWKNCVANQVVDPLKYFKPGTLEELLEIIKSAEREKCKVRAVG